MTCHASKGSSLLWIIRSVEKHRIRKKDKGRCRKRGGGVKQGQGKRGKGQRRTRGEVVSDYVQSILSL